MTHAVAAVAAVAVANTVMPRQQSRSLCAAGMDTDVVLL